jgi:2-dehydropantoate 2-reductase
MGAYPSGVNDAVRAVAAEFEGTPFDVSVTGSIMQAKWSELLMNLTNAIYGIIGISGQEGLTLAEVRHWMADVIEEGLKVVRAAGIACDAVKGQPLPQDFIKRLRSTDFEAPAIPRDEDMLHRRSLWQDLYLMRGAVESPHFNGEIVSLGRQLAIPTPLNEILLAKSTEIAATKAAPGQYTIEQLRSMV